LRTFSLFVCGSTTDEGRRTAGTVSKDQGGVESGIFMELGTWNWELRDGSWVPADPLSQMMGSRPNAALRQQCCNGQQRCGRLRLCHREWHSDSGAETFEGLHLQDETLRANLLSGG